jgi:RNA polymerase sigma-70 factor (ECF subfamily)
MGMVACPVIESLRCRPLLQGALRGAMSAEGRSPAEVVELSRAARNGDPEAFGRLVLLNERAAFGLCLRLLRDPEEARDAAQEAFVRAYEALPGYDVALSFTPWLLRIARNHCLDLLRRGRAAPALVRVDPQEVAKLERPDPTAQSPHDVAVGSETQVRLEAAIARLPADHREALLLFHREQLSYREIAAVLEVPMGTVMTWLHRARQRLRAELEENQS